MRFFKIRDKRTGNCMAAGGRFTRHGKVWMGTGPLKQALTAHSWWWRMGPMEVEVVELELKELATTSPDLYV